MQKNQMLTNNGNVTPVSVLYLQHPFPALILAFQAAREPFHRKMTSISVCICERKE